MTYLHQSVLWWNDDDMKVFILGFGYIEFTFNQN